MRSQSDCGLPYAKMFSPPAEKVRGQHGSDQCQSAYPALPLPRLWSEHPNTT